MVGSELHSLHSINWSSGVAATKTACLFPQDQPVLSAGNIGISQEIGECPVVLPRIHIFGNKTQDFHSILYSSFNGFIGILHIYH